MEGSLQCDLSYATFHIGDKAIKVDREPRVTHMLEENINTNVTNVFRAEITIQEIEKLVPSISQEEKKYLDSQNLWTMYFDGANSKEGS